jgi:glucosamine--fructose-6-phosphate aminotransferase (isomerizing)
MNIDERQAATETYQTILRQADDLRVMFARETSNITAAADVLRSTKRIITLGIGSSHHASLMGAWFLRAAGRDALAIHTFDWLHYPDQFPIRPDDGYVLFGHTGSTGFTRQALDRLVAAGAPVVAVGSTKAEHPGAKVVLRTTDPEKAATYTSSHLSAMAVVAALAVELGAQFGDALSRIPDQVAEILSHEADLWPIADLIEGKRIYAYGAPPDDVTATELMIKVREAAFHVIDGMAAEQFLHGPTVSFNSGDVAVVVNVPGPGQQRVQEIARVNQAMGGTIVAIGEAIPSVDGPVFVVPPTHPALSGLLTVVPMQLLATRLAAIRSTNPDSFRMDDPIYDAAFRKAGF